MSTQQRGSSKGTHKKYLVAKMLSNIEEYKVRENKTKKCGFLHIMNETERMQKIYNKVNRKTSKQLSKELYK